jgi:hypothetical protein
MESVEAHCPEANRFVVLADPLRDRFDPQAENFVTVGPEALEQVTNWPTLRFLVPASGICCVLKPIGALHLFEHFAPDKLVYFDADTLLLGRPASMIAALDEHAVVLTPHLVRVADFPEIDVNTMRSGAFNAGVFGVAHSETAQRFLNWWSINMLDPDKMAYAWNYDQGWLNLAPAAFPDTHVLRDPGCNLAFWNLHERKTRTLQGSSSLAVDEYPVWLFHFSFFEWRTPERLAGKYSDQLPPPPVEIAALQRDYATRLKKHGAEEVESWAYPYASFSDGHPIRSVHRAYFKNRVAALLPDQADPFDAGLKIPGLLGLKSLRNADSIFAKVIRQVRNYFS